MEFERLRVGELSQHARPKHDVDDAIRSLDVAAEECVWQESEKTMSASEKKPGKRTKQGPDVGKRTSTSACAYTPSQSEKEVVNASPPSFKAMSFWTWETEMREHVRNDIKQGNDFGRICQEAEMMLVRGEEQR